MKRLPHVRPLHPEPPEPMGLGEALLSIAMLVLIFVLAFIILPVLAS